MASSMRKLTPKLVTLSPPPTPKDVYKLLGVSGPTPKDVHTLPGVSGPCTAKDVHRLLRVGGLDTHPQKCCLLGHRLTVQ